MYPLSMEDAQAVLALVGPANFGKQATRTLSECVNYSGWLYLQHLALFLGDRTVLQSSGDYGV
jgi:hypothetical protein